MRTYLCYDKDGKVFQASEIPEDSLWMAKQDYGGRVVEVGDKSLLEEGVEGVYVSLDGPEPRVMKTSHAPLSVKTIGLAAKVSGAPKGSIFEVEGERLDSKWSEVEIEFDAPGTYEIRIYPPPQYRDEVLEVTVG